LFKKGGVIFQDNSAQKIGTSASRLFYGSTPAPGFGIPVGPPILAIFLLTNHGCLPPVKKYT
jgi:hypothetical protein